MRRVIQVVLLLAATIAGAYALLLVALLILASVVGCGCAATPSPPLP